LKFAAENLKFDGTDIMLTSKIKSEANAFCDQIPLIWRKDQALKSLVEKKKISPELYEDLHNNFDGALNQLKNDAQHLTGDIDKEIARCANEIKELNYALVNLEIEHEIGRINNESYQTAFTIIQDNLKRANTEKSDLELTGNKLSNILLGEAPKTDEQEESKIRENEQSEAVTSTSNAPELPEPPVVVYVKEIGKTGI
jgi:chromosome segregation ATPase